MVIPRMVVFEYSYYRCNCIVRANTVFSSVIFKKKSVINVKMRVKYFYAASGIILLWRENNRSSGVKGCLQETVLSTHVSAFLGRKGWTGGNTLGSCTTQRLGLSTCTVETPPVAFRSTAGPSGPSHPPIQAKGMEKSIFSPRLETMAENPRFGIRGQESMVGNAKLALDLRLFEFLIWQEGLTEGNVFMDDNPRGGPTPLKPLFFKSERHMEWADIHFWTVLLPWAILRLKAFFFFF